MAAARSNFTGCATDIAGFLRVNSLCKRFGTLGRLSCSKLVCGTESTPVPAVDADRHVDLTHHDGIAVAHVAGVALDQVGAQVAAGGEPRGVIEDAAVAAVGGVPADIAGALRMRVDLVV